MVFGPTEQSKRDEQRIDGVLTARQSFDAMRSAIRQRRQAIRTELRDLDKLEHHVETACRTCAHLANAPHIAGQLPPAA